MSFQESVPLRLTPGRSRALAFWIVAVHAAAAASLTMLQAVPPILRGLLALVVVAGAIRAIRFHGLRTAAGAIVGTTLDNAEWRLDLCNGTEIRARLLSSFVHPKIIVVRLAADRGRRFALVLAADALPSEDHRRLRMRLRQAVVSSAPADGG